MNKRLYTSPELEIVVFTTEDVIATSPVDPELPYFPVQQDEVIWIEAEDNQTNN